MPNITGLVQTNKTYVDKASGTAAIEMPSGSSAQRPSTAVNGMLRYNTDDNALEVYADNAWGSVGGDAGGDLDCGTASSQSGPLYDLGSASSA